MARMHSPGRGKSGSTKPLVDKAPEWSNTDAKEVTNLIISLAEEGHSAAAIGTILRDQHAVPDARLVVGKRIGKVLAENDITPKFPEDMMSLMRRALRLIDHLESNRKDLHNSRQLELTESKIRRLSRYYQGRGQLDTEWAYKRDQLRLMVE
ncbi:MAG: 30S ribosomal protein S15 [Candidatus Thalassarchaeaceae archaeon]|jgi:small subunit ribosomal protein S15|nr:30S ribosomal protein S15 [Candidatus Thalassarchaeaceae archaeon]MDP6844554.1 30S ribosomal protein S15 [Candidatus Thalassarchaeaceae archaeon]